MGYAEAQECSLYAPTASDSLSIEPVTAVGEAALNQYDFNWIADNVRGPLAHINQRLAAGV